MLRSQALALLGDAQSWERSIAVALGFAIPISTAADGTLSVLLLALWLIGGRYREKLEAIRANPVALAALALLAILVAGLLWGNAPVHDRLLHLRKYANLLFIPILIGVFADENCQRRAMLAFALAAGTTLLLSFALAFSLLHQSSWIGGTSADPYVFKSRITQSLLMSFAVLAAYTLARASSEQWFRVLMATLAVAAGLNVLTMLQGRTGYVVLPAVLALLLYARFRWRGIFAVAFAATIAFTLLYHGSERFHQRGTAVASEFAEWRSGAPAQRSVAYRLEFYTNTLRIIEKHPFAGVGTGGFRTAYREQVQNTSMVFTPNPHNVYLLIAAEAGLLGLLLLGYLLLREWQWAATLPQPGYSIAARGLVMIFALGGLFNSLLIDHTESIFFAWATALLCAVPAVRGAGRSSAETPAMRLPPT